MSAADSRLVGLRSLLGRPLLTEESHRVTSFEVFFDLVFVFAIVRVTGFIIDGLSALTLAEGILLVLLLWWSWCAYAWVGNQARADTGLVRAGVTVAMAAIFVAALVMPDAFDARAPMDPPVVLASAFAVTRLIYLALYLRATAAGRLGCRPLLLDTLPQVLILGLILGGALAGELPQAVMWAAAFLIDFGGRRFSPGLRSYRLRSPGHYAERYGLVLIIALGETLIAVGEGAGTSITHWLVLVAAVLGLAIVVCLWWLYSGCAASAERALKRAGERQRAALARNAYTRAHFLLIVGALYLAAGLEEVISHVTTSAPSQHAEPALGWLAAVALYGGVAVFLTGRFAFVQFADRSAAFGPVAGACVAIVLLPAAASLPALAALGLLCAVVGAVTGYDRRTAEPTPASGRSDATVR